MQLVRPVLGQMGLFRDGISPYSLLHCPQRTLIFHMGDITLFLSQRSQELSYLQTQQGDKWRAQLLDMCLMINLSLKE